jgi:ornithine decarboxylase
MMFEKASETAVVSIGEQKLISVSDHATPNSCAKWVIDNWKESTDTDSFYMMSMSVLMAQWRKWQMLMPSVHPYYAVKANPNPMLLRLLASLGANFDCASKGEIDLVRSIGVTSERIIFANTCKPTDALIYARRLGVDLMTVDNELELEKIKKYFPCARLVIRIQVGDPTALVKLSSKFGATPSGEAPTLLRSAVNKGLTVVGVSFHVGGGCNDATVYDKAIKMARVLFKLGKTLNQQMSLLDIGGGFPGFCTADISLYKISRQVNMSIKEQFSDWENFTAIAEPGRYFAMPAATLCTSVFAKRSCSLQSIKEEAPDVVGEEEAARMYYITDGIFNSFNCVPVYKIYPPFEIIGKERKGGRQFPSRIWGPTCDSADCIYECIDLPELAIGDWLTFTYMGAYTSCITTNFNCMPIGLTQYLVTNSDRAEVVSLLRKSYCAKPRIESIGRPIDLDVLNESETEDSGMDSSPVSPDSNKQQEPDNNKEKTAQKKSRRRFISVA